MLGGGSFTVKTLTEIRRTERMNATYIPVMLHYLPTANSLVAVHLPYLHYNIAGTEEDILADIKVLGKYQFYRKDGTGKTFRMVAKTLQSIPTGDKVDIIGLSTGFYESYFGIVAGYESLKYGISTEMGYNLVPDGTQDEFRVKGGFGLPLLKPQYPNKQVNLFFEYTSSLFPERDWYQLLYAQGVQYARKNITFDLAIQWPLTQDVDEGREFLTSVFLGTRFTF
ncbi:hypothetical protein GCM10009117_22650 [Gangjinia marincola]|uniref:Uncharacterized protein n=2 Tax=Gangjinia marincola TaxID=578463 RepID=A0ABP3XUK8_9FLAO